MPNEEIKRAASSLPNASKGRVIIFVDEQGRVATKDEGGAVATSVRPLYYANSISDERQATIPATTVQAVHTVELPAVPNNTVFHLRGFALVYQDGTIAPQFLEFGGTFARNNVGSLSAAADETNISPAAPTKLSFPSAGIAPVDDDTIEVSLENLTGDQVEVCSVISIGICSLQTLTISPPS